MKKAIAYLSIILISFYSCFKSPEPIPPRIYVEPETETLNISVIHPVTFYIRAKSDEDLKSFAVQTTPFIYAFDTTFGSFVHSFTKTITIRLPSELSQVPDDSLIQVQFILKDYYNTKIVTKFLHIVEPYPELYEDTVVLYFPRSPSFYDTQDRTTKDSTAQRGSFDLVYAFSSDDGITIASPDAYWLESVFASNARSYSASGQRHTKINYSNVEFNDMDDRFMYYLNVNPHYIESNQAYGIGVEALTLNSVFVFQTQDNIKGAGKIIGATADSIILAIKFQKWAVDTSGQKQ